MGSDELSEHDGRSSLFSVIIPTFNRSSLLLRAVRSVLGEDFESMELLVIDDGSTDDTKERIAELDDRRLRFIELPRGGAARAQNIGAQHARGQYLIFLDSDDEALPGWLSTMALARTTRTALISTDSWSVDDIKATRYGATELAYPGSGLRARILSGTYALRKDVFESIGGFDENLRSGTKTDLSLKLLAYLRDTEESIVHVGTPLVLHHRNSPLSVRMDDRAVLEGTEMLLQRYSSELANVPRVRADYHGVAGVRAVRIGDKRRARRHLWASAKADPKNLRRWARLITGYMPWSQRLWKPSRVEFDAQI